MSHDQPYESPKPWPADEPGSPSNVPRTRPRVWPSVLAPIAGIGVAAALQAVVIIGLVIFGQAFGSPPDLLEMLTDPPVFILLLILGQLGFAIVAFAAGHFSPEPMRQRVAFPAKPASKKIYLLTMLGSIFVLAIAALAANAMTLLFEPDKSFENLFEKMTIGWAIPFVLLIGILPGFFEEILFRGYVQTRFLKRWSPPVAIAVSSILFGIAHVAPHSVALATVFGIWFGYIAWRCDSIGPGILCHFFVNAGLNLWRMIVKFAEISDTVQWVVSVVLVVVGLICFVLAIRELQKLPPPTSFAPEMTGSPS